MCLFMYVYIVSYMSLQTYTHPHVGIMWADLLTYKGMCDFVYIYRYNFR